MPTSSKKTDKKVVGSGDFQIGDLVYITPAGHDWITRFQNFPNIQLTGRTASIVDIYDWNTPRGKDILAKRAETGKWTSLQSEDFKYILMVFYPDLERDEKRGLMHPEMLCRYHPRHEGSTPVPLFEKYPSHLLPYVRGEKVVKI